MKKLNLISLLKSPIQYASVSSRGTHTVRELPEYAWDGIRFGFLNKQSDHLIFNELHHKLAEDFSNEMKFEYLKTLISEIKEQVLTKGGTSFLIVPTNMPEWAIHSILDNARKQHLKAFCVMRCAFLAAIKYYIEEMKIDDGMLKSCEMHSFCEKFENGYHLSKTKNEDVTVEEIGDLLIKYLNDKKGNFSVFWPITLGILDQNDKWWELLNSEQVLPFQRHFSFELPAKSSATSLKILAKAPDDFFIETQRMELPENHAINSIQYSLKLTFQNTWTGFYDIKTNESVVQTGTLELPFFSYWL